MITGTQPIKDIPAFGEMTVIYLRKRRHVCPICSKRFYETVPFLPRYYRITNRLAAYVIKSLKEVRSMKSVSRLVNLSPPTVARIFDHVGYSPKLCQEFYHWMNSEEMLAARSFSVL
ncbi:MAG: helix-turn-helix domain-containing protein [Acetivibrionales bacterium]